MLRIFYCVLLPFLLPFLIYGIRIRSFHFIEEKYPFKILTIIGLILVFIFLFFFCISDRSPADNIYTLPKFEDGKIIPAHMSLKNDKND